MEKERKKTGGRLWEFRGGAEKKRKNNPRSPRSGAGRVRVNGESREEREERREKWGRPGRPPVVGERLH